MHGGQAQWTGQLKPLLPLYSAQVSAPEQPQVLYSNLQLLSACLQYWAKYRNVSSQLEVSRVQLERISPPPCSAGFLDLIPTHKLFKFDDGEVTEAKMDNNELCMCVLLVICGRKYLCNHVALLDIVSRHAHV